MNPLINSTEVFDTGDVVKFNTEKPRLGTPGGVVCIGDLGTVRWVDKDNCRIVVDFPDHEGWPGFTDEVLKIKTY